MFEIKLYKSRWKAVKLLLLTLPFVILSLYDIISHSLIMPSYIAWLCLCFFVLGIPVSLFHFFDRRPQIIINDIGIFDRMAYTDFINWNLIEDAYLVNVHNQKFICLTIDNAAINLIKNKKYMKLSKQMGFQEINLSLGQIKIDEIKFMDFILTMSKANITDKQFLIDNFRA